MATCTRDGTRLVDARDFAEAQADPLLGTTIAGRYGILERIGVGGMGTVYRATQAGLERQVALKILKKELTWDGDTVTRFHREARAMSLLTHPNTVRVFDFGETPEGLLFFAMELLEGELLTTRIQREGSLAVDEAIRVAQQILRSLSEAHSKGIIHRDLKPDNIYLAQVEGHPEPVVKVLDFGIAKVVQGDRMIDQLETQAGTVFGTPRYMSPEQAQGKKLDPRSDLYSVGILLFQMLTGRAPFVDDDAVVVMAKHIRERPPPVRDVAPDRPIPASLERAVTRAIEKDPAARFKTAERFASRLEQCLPEVAREQAGRRSLVAGLRRTLRRAPRGPLLAGAGVLTAAVAMAAFLVTGSVAEDATMPERVAAPPENSARPVARTASLTVRSEPEGAEVWWEGAMLGTTPLTVERPHGSRMGLRLELEGFEDTEVEVVADGSPHDVQLTPLEDEAPEAHAEAAAAEEGSAERERVRRRRPRRAGRRQRARSAETSEPAEAGQPRAEPDPTPAAPDEPYERW